jgi:hypothetical protein
VVLAWWAGGCGAGDADAIEVGDCITIPDPDTIREVDCSGTHDGEVVEIFSFDAGLRNEAHCPRSGDNAIRNSADDKWYFLEEP